MKFSMFYPCDKSNSRPSKIVNLIFKIFWKLRMNNTTLYLLKQGKTKFAFFYVCEY
jgi:hypothetical protein